MSFTAGGTVRWMSPELLDPDRFGIADDRPTKASDCYALGMVVYEVSEDAVATLSQSDLTCTSSGAFRESSLLGDRKPKWGDECDREGRATRETGGSQGPRVYQGVVGNRSTLLARRCKRAAGCEGDATSSGTRRKVLGQTAIDIAVSQVSDLYCSIERVD